MAERFVGIDVALREHRIAVLDRDGEAVGPSFTIAASQGGVATLLQTLAARDATAAQTLIGLEASGHLWENLEAALVGAGYRVLVLNPLQTRRYRDVVRRKAKTDDIDAHVIAGLIRSGAAQASYVPDEQIQSLRELARLRARLLADRQDYLRQLIAQLDVVLPEHRTVLGDLLSARARGILAQFPTAPHLAKANPRAIRRAAEDAGTRGFSLNDAIAVRDAARQSIYSGKAAAARRRPACRPSARALRAIRSTSLPSMLCVVVASGARFISARRPKAKRPSRRWSLSPSSCFTRSTPCSNTGNPTTRHVCSSHRRRVALDISWDVSVGMVGGSLAEPRPQ